MPEVSFPGDGQDGKEPLPGGPARDEAGGAPSGPVDDWDPDAEMAAFIADLEAGRTRIPEEWEIESRPAATISLGDAADVDLAGLTAMLGPDGLGGEVFAQDRPADVMRPGPVLAALTESAAAAPGRLTDNQLLGAISAARRLAARAEYLELHAIAEFTRRRQAQAAAAKARKVPADRRPGEFAAEELAMELVTSANAARDRMGMAGDLETRLPATRAALAAGVIDGYRARIIWKYTRFLSDACALQADQVLAGAAPRLRYDQLARKAVAAAMKLDPEVMTRGKDQARKDRQRVEARREETGNASLSGRELAIEDALASKAHIDTLAAALRRGGLAGSLRQLRVLVFLDLTQGRNPLHRLTAPVSEDDAAGGTGTDEGRAGIGDDDRDDDGEEGSGPMPGRPAPLPALINLVVPAGTLFGWSAAPGDAGGWDLTDPDDTRRLVAAASADTRTRWCLTLTGPDDTAIAHGCARGRHTWTPPPPAPADTRQAAALAELLRRLNVTLTPIAKGTCDHRNAEDRYTASRKLKHLIRARTATCPAPGCGAQSQHSDLDHTVAYPAGPTDECNLAPPCRRHHRCKQAPGWQLSQPAPGVMRWQTPSGRGYATRPTSYES